MVALQVAVTVVLVRRRRRFGTLRPDVPIVPISACSVRGGLLRRADFTDGTRATYGGTARLRTALTTRVVTDLAIAVRDGRLARNPADHVPLPRAAREEKTVLTVEQVEALADDAGAQPLVILFLAYTGVRFGELAALRVRRLDLMRRRAEIVEALAEVHGRAVFSTPKTHQARSVLVPRFLVDGLVRQVARRGPDDFVLTSPRGGLSRHPNSGTPSSRGLRGRPAWTG